VWSLPRVRDGEIDGVVGPGLLVAVAEAVLTVYRAVRPATVKWLAAPAIGDAESSNCCPAERLGLGELPP